MGMCAGRRSDHLRYDTQLLKHGEVIGQAALLNYFAVAQL